MVNIRLTLYTKGFFGSFLKSPIQMGSLSINNSVMNISRLGTFKEGGKGVGQGRGKRGCNCQGKAGQKGLGK